jgi:SAM-dependent methyltransferase
MTILAGLLLCFHGLSRFVHPAQPHLSEMLHPVVQAVQRTVIGAIMENSEPDTWDRAYYDRLVELKNVEYWRSLYACVDPTYASPLYPFLEKYYTLAQYLNDVQDFAEDQARGQPNLLSLYLAHEGEPAGQYTPPVNGAGAEHVADVAPADAQAFLAQVFFELDAMAEKLPAPERLIAQLKLHESLTAAQRYGLFGAMGEDARDGDGREDWADIRLDWHATAADVVARAGSQALVETHCGVCGATERSYLFRKDGFAYHRCVECSHIYVSPRISADLQVHIGDMVDLSEERDIYLDVQKLYASSLCNLLRSQAPGRRLLDIGFGSGYLAELAQAYGFEVFGVDSSSAKVDALWPRWGHRLLQVVIGRDEIPWHSFDVVIMSHVIEHLPDPRATLLEVHNLMNPGGLLYVAVPDVDSLPFHIFGKRWDVINPLVHFQYFNRDSLERLLRSCGFAGLEQVEHPQKPSMLASNWDRLMRELTGSESTELSLLARVDKPHDADSDD